MRVHTVHNSMSNCIMVYSITASERLTTNLQIIVRYSRRSLYAAHMLNTQMLIIITTSVQDNINNYVHAI